MNDLFFYRQGALDVSARVVNDEEDMVVQRRLDGPKVTRLRSAATRHYSLTKVWVSSVAPSSRGRAALKKCWRHES